MTCSCGREPDPGICDCGAYGGSHCACAPHANPDGMADIDRLLSDLANPKDRQ